MAPLISTRNQSAVSGHCHSRKRPSRYPLRSIANLKFFRKRKITCVCPESLPGQSSSSRSAARLLSDLLCPCCTVRAMQVGGDTHSKMTPITGTHSILVPGTKTAYFAFNCLSVCLPACFEVLCNFCLIILTQNSQCVMLV